MKWLAVIGGVFALAVVATIVIGYLQPVKHHVTRSATFHVSAETLYALITNVDALPTWRSTVKAVEHDGPTRFREIGSNDRILYEVVERTPRRIVTRIADPKLPFGGTWTYALLPTNSTQTTLRITEDGEIYNPVFRFVSRFAMGHTATIDQYLRDVSRHLSEEPAIS